MSTSRGEKTLDKAKRYLSEGRPARALGLFGELTEQNVLNAQFAKEVSQAFVSAGDLSGATESLIAAGTVLSRHETELLATLGQCRKDRAKVAFFCESLQTNFLDEIYKHFNQRYETRFFTGNTPEGISKVMEWCDIAWFEWCTPQFVLATMQRKTCRIICRLHRYEAFRDWPKQARWENVDALITVGNESVLNYLKKSVPGIDKRTRVVPIPNGVDLERFVFKDRAPGKQIACVGHLNYWKHSMFLLQCFYALYRQDDEYRLRFIGEFEDDGVLREYLDNMLVELKITDVVTFEEHTDDVPGWLEDKHYIASASMVEGHPVNIIEGMACGLKPIVHTWPGSRGFFPDEYLFRTPEEFCKRIVAEPYEPQKYRDFVEEKYSLRHQIEKIQGVFDFTDTNAGRRLQLDGEK